MRTFESEPMQIPMPAHAESSTGANPSPRFASVVGQTQTRAPASASRSSSRRVGMRRVDDGRVRARGSRSPRAARSAAARARRGTPRSRAAARRRARAAAATRPRRSARAPRATRAGRRGRSGGQGRRARRSRGAPRAAPGSRRPTPAGTARCPPRPYADEQQDELDPGLRRGLDGRVRLGAGRGSGTRRPPCSRRRASRGRPRRSPARTRSAVSPAGQLEHRLAPGPEVAAFRRGRAARAGTRGECAFTKPGSERRLRHLRILSPWPLAPFPLRWRRSRTR